MRTVEDELIELKARVDLLESEILGCVSDFRAYARRTDEHVGALASEFSRFATEVVRGQTDIKGRLEALYDLVLGQVAT